MTKRRSVGLIFGGESPEHEVSIVTARSIAQHLDPVKYDVIPIGVARNGVWTVLNLNGKTPFDRLVAQERPEKSTHPFLPLEKGSEATPLPDIFFNAIHGASGEDGQLQGYLQLLHRPYTGAGLLAMAAGMDKWITKRIWQSEGLPVVPFVGLTEERWQQNPQENLSAIEVLGYPLFVKPANLGSSIGIEKVKKTSDLSAALARAFTYDRRVLVEQGLSVRELEVAVLGGEAPFVSVVGEVLVGEEFYTFHDKYVGKKSTTQIPAAIPTLVSDQIRHQAQLAFRALDAYGMARVDFFMETTSGKLFLNEINLIPGFTAISMYPKLMEASGLSYAALLDRLIDLALDRHAKELKKNRGFESGHTWA